MAGSTLIILICLWHVVCSFMIGLSIYTYGEYSVSEGLLKKYDTFIYFWWEVVIGPGVTLLSALIGYLPILILYLVDSPIVYQNIEPIWYVPMLAGLISIEIIPVLGPLYRGIDRAKSRIDSTKKVKQQKATDFKKDKQKETIRPIFNTLVNLSSLNYSEALGPLMIKDGEVYFKSQPASLDSIIDLSYEIFYKYIDNVPLSFLRENL